MRNRYAERPSKPVILFWGALGKKIQDSCEPPATRSEGCPEGKSYQKGCPQGVSSTAGEGALSRAAHASAAHRCPRELIDDVVGVEVESQCSVSRSTPRLHGWLSFCWPYAFGPRISSRAMHGVFPRPTFLREACRICNLQGLRTRHTYHIVILFPYRSRVQ